MSERSCGVRTCVVCREACLKGSLLRLVVRDGVFTLDLLQQLEGRGVYVHPESGCLYHKKLWQLLLSSLNRSTSGRSEAPRAVAAAGDLREVLKRGLCAAKEMGGAGRMAEMTARVEEIVRSLERAAGGDGKQPRPKGGAKLRL